jgi:hypothetical protein
MVDCYSKEMEQTCQRRQTIVVHYSPQGAQMGKETQQQLSENTGHMG